MNFTASLLTIGLLAADPPVAAPQEPAPAAQVEGPAPPETMQIATEEPRRRRRPPLDPATRELRQTRGILAGGIVLTALCGAGFGLAVYAIVDAGKKLQGASGSRVFGAAGAMLACTAVSIAAIGVSSKRLRARRGARVAWAGGLGLHF